MTKENWRSVHGNQDTAVVKSVQKMCISKYSNECAFQVQWGRCAIPDRAANTCNSENSRCFVWNPTFSFSCSRKLGKLSLWLLCCHGNDRDFVAKKGRLAFFTIGLKKDWFSPQSWTLCCSIGYKNIDFHLKVGHHRMSGGVGVDAVDHRRLVIVLVLQPEVDGVGYEDEECNNFSIENHRNIRRLTKTIY